MYLQLATALYTLKNIGVIHTDIHPGTIMVVDQRAKPLTVKITEFGLAIPKSQAKTGMTLQLIHFR